MNCDKVTDLLDDYIDEELPLDQRRLLIEHVASCESCRRELDELAALRAQLRNLPVNAPPAGFADRILRTARNGYTRRHMGMFATGAAAAGLVIMLVAGVMRMTTENSTDTVTTIQMVELNVLESRTISLAFSSPAEINDVTFTLDLPDGIELSGHPDKRELVWKDTLSDGKNVLQLTLLGQKQMTGTLKASIEHAGKRREFSIPLQVREAGAALSPAQGLVV
jgi:hypothetical protein